MIYYLLYNSSLFEDQEEDGKKMSILMYGSISYVVIHAFINFTQNDILLKLKPYFWLIWILDIIITVYNIFLKKKKINVTEIFDLKNDIQNLLTLNDNQINKESNKEKPKEITKKEQKEITKKEQKEITKKEQKEIVKEESKKKVVKEKVLIILKY